MQWFIYLFKVSLCSGVFFLFYHLIISKFTFFNFNRWYLISSLVISFIIPALTIEVKKEVPAIFHKSVNYQIPFSNQAFNEYDPEDFEGRNATRSSLNWEHLLLYTYWIISFLLLIKLLRGIVQIMKSRKRYSEEDGIRLVLVEPVCPFKNSSFFNYLFIDRTLPEDSKKQIIAHEQVHVNSRHFADKLIANINVVILWFNPFAYAYLHAIDANHEYEADYKTTKNRDKQLYAHLVLSLTRASTNLFINHFGKSPVKKRIKMLYKKPTHRMKKLTYLSVLPLVALCCLAFMNKEEVLLYSKSNVTVDQLSPKKLAANKKVTVTTKHQPSVTLSASAKKTEVIIRHQQNLTISATTKDMKSKVNDIYAQPVETIQYILPTAVKSNEGKKLKQYVLVIDPGHGGKDDAAIGINRVKEKDMNLTAALILKEEAEKRGIKVIMTRKSDVFVTLHDRVAMQNEGNAFISIHHNILTSPETKQNFQAFKGLEVIASDQSGLKASRILGSEVLQSLKNIKGIDVRDSLTKASIYVVRETKIPSILVEMGNISYQDSFIFLKKEENVRKICNLILDGFINFES